MQMVKKCYYFSEILDDILKLTDCSLKWTLVQSHEVQHPSAIH